MKNILSIKRMGILLFMLGCSMTGMAQESENTSGSSREQFGFVTMDLKPMSLLPKHGDNVSVFGIYVGGGYGFRIGKIELESGLGLQQNFGSTSEGGTDIDYKWLSWCVTVNVGYKFNIPNSKISVVPFAGMFSELLLSGTEKIKYGSQTTTLHLTDTDDMGSADNTWTGTICLEGGAKIYFGKNFMAKLKYGHSVMNYAKDLGVQYFSIGAAFVL